MKTPNLKYAIILLVAFVFGVRSNAQVGLCPSNLDFEQGNFTGWQCKIGSCAGGNLILNPSPPTPDRHVIINSSNAGIDIFGQFPTLCPNGSGNSVKLGNWSTGSGAESVSYTYSIPATATNFSMLFYYAVVMDNPSGHPLNQQPRFQCRIIDLSTNSPVPCVDFDFISSTAPGGFQVSSLLGHTGVTVLYKDWTSVSINLEAYIGKTIMLEFITRDCGQSGHAGYAYLDVYTACNGAIQGRLCEGETDITLTAPFGYQSYQWFSDQTFTTPLNNTQSITLSPAPPVGTILPVIVGPFPGYGCDDTLYATVTQSPKPPTDAGPDQVICNNQQVQLGVAASPGYNYEWRPSSQVSSPIISNPFVTSLVNNPEEFIVKTTDILSGCFAEDTTYITSQTVDTTMNINGVTTYCTGDPNPGMLVLTSASLAAVQWYEGTTPIPGATGSSYQPTASGNYWAQVQQGGCTDSTRIIAFNIGITPVSYAGFDDNLCTNQTIQIGGPPTAGVNYSWTPAAQVSNPNISDPIASVFNSTTVEFIVRSTDPLSGCYSQDTVYITGLVVDTVMAVVGKKTYCTGDTNPAILNVNAGHTSVQWYNGATPIAGATGNSYQPTVSGSYWAELSQLGCLDSTRTELITINTTPVSNAGADQNICANQTIQIGAAATPGINYAWTPAGQVSNPAAADPTAWVNDGTPVQFIVTSTDPATGCFSKDTTIVSGRVVDTTLALIGTNDYCTGNPAAGTLTANSGFTGIQWYDGTTPIVGATTASYHPLVSGNYWAQIQQFGCTDSTRTVAFDIHLTPIPGFFPSADTGCVTRNSFTFTNTSTAPDGATLSNLWIFSDGTTQTGLDAVKTFMTTGLHTVKLKVTSEYGCVDSTGFTNVRIMPNADAGFRWDSICINRPSLFYNVTSENSSPQVNYSWEFNDGNPPVNIKDPGAITYTTPGKVDVRLIATTLGCENDPDTAIHKVQVNVAKPGTRYTDITVPEGAKRFIHARDTIGTFFQWSPMVQLSNYNTRYTEFTATNDVLYTIRISDIHTCVTIDTLQMLVLKKPGYYLPTAFTPNGDGLNDVARPYLVRMKNLISFSIFERRGQRIFHTQTEGKGWDGRLNGDPMPSGVYVWVLEFFDANNQRVLEKGTITLIR